MAGIVRSDSKEPVTSSLFFQKREVTTSYEKKISKIIINPRHQEIPGGYRKWKTWKLAD